MNKLTPLSCLDYNLKARILSRPVLTHKYYFNKAQFNKCAPLTIQNIQDHKIYLDTFLFIHSFIQFSFFRGKIVACDGNGE